MVNSCGIGSVAWVDINITCGEGSGGHRFAYYPNPATEELIVSFESNSNVLRVVSLYDRHGKLVSEQSTTDMLVKIETTKIAKGKHFLHVLENGKVYKSQVEIK